VIVTSTQPSCRCADLLVYGNGIVEPELGNVQAGVLLISSADADEVVKDLRQPYNGKRGAACGDESLDLGRSGLVLEEGKYGVGVEDRQPRRDFERLASSRRASCRAWSVRGPRPLYLPRSSCSGWSPSGRMTTRSPRSTTSTCLVLQRARASAGIET
jgi:hypothetical protein